MSSSKSTTPADSSASSVQYLMQRAKTHPNDLNLGERLLCLLYSSQGSAGDCTLVSTKDQSRRKIHKDVLAVWSQSNSLKRGHLGKKAPQIIEVPLRSKQLDMLVELLYTSALNIFGLEDAIPLYITARLLELNDTVGQIGTTICTDLGRYLKVTNLHEFTPRELGLLMPLLSNEANSFELRDEIVEQLRHWLNKRGASTNVTKKFKTKRKIDISDMMRRVKMPPPSTEKAFLIWYCTHSELYHSLDLTMDNKHDQWHLAADEDREILCIIDGIMIVYRNVKRAPDDAWRLPGCCDTQSQEVTFVKADGCIVRQFFSGSFLGMTMFKRRLFVWTSTQVFAMESSGWKRMAMLPRVSDKKVDLASSRLEVVFLTPDNFCFAFDVSNAINEPCTYKCSVSTVDDEIDVSKVAGVLLGVHDTELILLNVKKGVEARNDEGFCRPILPTGLGHITAFVCGDTLFSLVCSKDQTHFSLALTSLDPEKDSIPRYPELSIPLTAVFVKSVSTHS